MDTTQHNLKPFKVYKLQFSGETETVAARTTIEALKFLKEQKDIEFDGLSIEDEITEIPECVWGEIKIRSWDDPQDPPKTIAEMIDGITQPYLIASTLY